MNPMSRHLDEDHIREVGLIFLSRFYAKRQAEGQRMLTAGQQVSGEIVTDAYLKYLAADGREYHVVLEATSWHTREEVLYKPLMPKRSWDAIMLSSWITAIGVAVSVELGWLRWELGGGTFFWAVCIALFLSLFLIIRAISRSRYRYRYIYAIEQFKAYRSDDQWIAIGADVFRDPQDPSYQELRRQCIATGVGLLIVYPNDKVNLVVAAARSTMDVSRSGSSSFLEKSERWLRSRERLIIPAIARTLPGRGLSYTKGLMRFRPKHWKQVFLSLVAFSVLGVTLVRFYQQKPERVLNAYQWRRSVDRPLLNPVEEPGFFKIDTPFLESYSREVGEYMFRFDSLQAIYRNTQLPDGYSPSVPTGRENAYLIAVLPDLISVYPCTRIQEFSPDRYALVHSTVPSYSEARIRLRNFLNRGVELKAVRMSCLVGGRDHYLVFWQLGFLSSESARKALQDYQELQEDNPELPDLRLEQLRRAF